MSSMNIPAVDQIGTALSLASLRNQAIASNIANRDTEGYQRVKVQFGDLLGTAPSATEQTSFAGSEDSASMRRPALIKDESGKMPSLEQDMVDLSTNAMHFQALARVLTRYFSIEEAIANGGRV